MLLGRVMGTLTPCRRVPGTRRRPDALDSAARQTGQPQGRAAGRVRFDAHGRPRRADLFRRRTRSRAALEPWFVPVDHTIVGIVDELHHES